MNIRAVFENGVFRPIEQVSFTEGSVIGLEIVEESLDVRSLVPPGKNCCSEPERRDFTRNRISRRQELHLQERYTCKR